MTTFLNPAALFAAWSPSTTAAAEGASAAAARDLPPHVPTALPCAFVPLARLWRPEIGPFSRAAVEDAAQTWARNGARLNARDVLAVEAVVHGFLLHAGADALASYRRLWESIPYATSHAAYPRIATPEGSVADHLNGLRLLRDTWGVGVASRWREGDFDAAIRGDVGKEFFITASPGSHETVAGVDYRLHWEGVDADGREASAVVSVVGVVRRRDGFAVTLTQGGPRLTEIKIDRNGKISDLLKLVQYRFGNDPRAWLAQEALKSLRRDHGDVPVYWLSAERRAPLYAHVIDPERAPHSLFGDVGRLPLEELRERVRRSPSPEAKRLPRTIHRLNAIARSLGFRGSEGETWWVRSCGD